MSVPPPRAQSRFASPSTSLGGPRLNLARPSVLAAARTRNAGPCSAARTRLDRVHYDNDSMVPQGTLRVAVGNSYMYHTGAAIVYILQHDPGFLRVILCHSPELHNIVLHSEGGGPT